MTVIRFNGGDVTPDAVEGALRGLGGQVDREAAKTRAYRDALSVLLDDFEWLLGQEPKYAGPYSDARIEGIRDLLAEGSAAQDEGPRAGDPTVEQLDEWFPTGRETT